MINFEWNRPQDIAQATQAATATVASAMVSSNGKPSTQAAVFKAGGIDLLDLMKEGLIAPRCLVNLRELPGLDLIEPTADGLRIGTNVTLAQLANNTVVRARYRALADATAVSASPQIRNVATIGGNLLQRPRCWYFRSREHHCSRKGGHTCFAFSGENQYHAIFSHSGCAIVHPSTAATALVALDANLELASATGETRVVPLEQFLLLPEVDPHRENDLRPGEIVTAVLLRSREERFHSVHLKQGQTESFDWPIADVAVALSLAPDRSCQRASIVLGAAAPVPHRAKAAEALLAGKVIDDGVARTAATAALQGAMPLSGNAYKIPIFEALVRRAVVAAAHGA